MRKYGRKDEIVKHYKSEYFGGRFVTIRDRHESCPHCGGDLEVFDEPEDGDDYDYDSELAQAWGFPARPEDEIAYPQNPVARFFYTYRIEQCANNALGEWTIDDGFDEDFDDDFEEDEDCEYQAYIFPRYYFNPATCLFDAPRPLSPTDQARYEREQSIAAGQQLLFLDDVE